MKPSVAAILLNHDSTDDTLTSLRALAASTYRQVIPVVVDTADGSNVAPLVSALAPGVTVLPLDENLGYAGGNNAGIRWAMDREIDHVLVMNPDVRLQERTLEGLVRAMDADRRIGVAGCRLLHGDDPQDRIWFDGGVIDRGRAGATSHAGAGVPDRERRMPDDPIDVDYVTGALMLLRRELLLDVGLLPERWFLYFEETEYNLRCQLAGWRTVVVPGVRARHAKRSSGRIAEPYYIYYFIRNRLVFSKDVIGAPLEIALEDLSPFIEHWRDRTARHAGHGLEAFDLVVETAIDHGVRGVTGRFDGLQALGSWT